MLYERWREVARACSEQWALRDLASNGLWTFAQLAAAAEQGGGRNGDAAFPQSNTADFILTVLRAWRVGQVVCPLEIGEPIPRFGDSFPPGVAHLKLTSATTSVP